MQQAPPLPPLKPKGKEQEAKDLAVAQHAQPEDSQPAIRLCVHLCAGTGIVSVCLSSLIYCCPSPLHPTHPPPTLHPLPHSLPAQCTMVAKHDYSVVMVDDGAGGPDRLIQYNPYWRTRPEVNPERPWPGPQHELDHLSSKLQRQGQAEGGTHHRKLVLMEQSTATLDPHQMRAPSVALLDTSCRTRSRNSQAWHQRNESNCYLGITDDALQDDIDLVKQLELLMCLCGGAILAILAGFMVRSRSGTYTGRMDWGCTK